MRKSAETFGVISLALILFSLLPAGRIGADCGQTVNVSDVTTLYDAVKGAKDGDCILLADGTYHLTENRPLRFNGVNRVVLTSASHDPTKVIIQGTGFTDDGSQSCSPHRGEENNDCLWIADNAVCSSITVSAITFTEACYGIKVYSQNSPQDIDILSCRFINLGYRCIKGTADTGGNAHAMRGLIRDCYFEDNKVPPPCWVFNGDYIAGIDMMRLDSWTIEDNTFLNIKGAHGGARAAVFIWVGCQNCIVQRNHITGCDRGVTLGLPASTEENGDNQVVRNNFISGNKDSAIEMCRNDGCKIYNNSCYRPDEGGSGITCLGHNTVTDTSIKNNLMNEWLETSGSQCDTSNNEIHATANYWVNPGAGDLHLTSQAEGAIGKGVALPEVTEDIDHNPRKDPPDIGASEFNAGPSSQQAPANP